MVEKVTSIKKYKQDRDLLISQEFHALMKRDGQMKTPLYQYLSDKFGLCQSTIIKSIKRGSENRKQGSVYNE